MAVQNESGNLVTVVVLSNEPLSLEALAAKVTFPSCGAVATFSGTTRDNFEGKAVVELAYEAYDEMAEQEMRAIAARARAKWPGVKGVAMAHRKGVVPVCQASVVICVSSPHRQAALEAVGFCIDELKERVPIWKKEVYADGPPSWKQNAEYLRAAAPRCSRWRSLAASAATPPAAVAAIIAVVLAHALFRRNARP